MTCPVCGRAAYDAWLGPWAELGLHILRNHPEVPEGIRQALSDEYLRAVEAAAKTEASS